VLATRLQTRVDALGVDEQADLAWLDRTLPKNFPLQGNLDPALLQAGGSALQLRVQEIITLLRNRPHIFNLGHGIWPTTPIAHVEGLLASVRGG
jgi:uroporphyrinogen decarboxylase